MEQLQDTDTQKHLDFAGRRITLVGTAHVSAQSISEVTDAIERTKPDCVAIELDEKRLQSLKDPDSWRKMDIVKVLRNKQGFLMLANIVLSGYQKRMGQSGGVHSGDEMVAAIKKAEELDIPQVMVDRPIAVTFRRAWAKNSLWGKCKLMAALLASAFCKEEVSTDQIEQLKQQSEMDTMMAELSDYLPKVKEVLIDERDRYLASHIWECKGEHVLAVLGAGHLPGVVAHLNRLASGEENSDCSDISGEPPKKLISKIAAWIIPVLVVALIVAGFIWGGTQKGWDMLSSWVMWNGLLAGAGALIAGGNILAVLASILSAPFTSLCPFVGVGMVAGLVQALVNKPKVSDMETLQDDSGSLKGFYKNRILRVLLVFVLSSLGSTAGTFIAGASFVVTISSFFDKIVDAIKALFH